MMVKEEESKSIDIEEGEISDESQSVEEITEEDFKPKGGGGEDSRVWMGGDLFKYSNNYGSGNYGSGLYNFAWAQAVQNKPLSESLVREYEFANNNNELNQRSSTTTTTTTTTSSSKEVCNVIIDDSSEEIDSNKVDEEMEEGELEEGEIELDSEMKDNCGNSVEKMNDEEFEKRIIAIIETLETVTVNDAEKSFDEVCSRLQRCLDSLHFIVSECGVSKIGALVEEAFDGIQAVNSVFRSFNSKQKEQNKEDLSRLLAHVKGQVPALFSAEQMKEIQATMDSLDSPSVLSSVKDMEVDEEPQVSTGVKNESGILGEKPPLIELGILGEKPGLALKSSEKGLLQPVPFKLGDRNNSINGPEILKQGLSSGGRSRGSFGPLLDLHGDHDVDSLPSPTREAPPPLYLREQRVIGDGNVNPKSTPKIANKSEDASMHLYETDALKAVSTYQQKFSRTSYLLSSRLPSPTPSEESDGGDGDCNGEVSSSSTVGNVRAIHPPVPSQPVASFASHMDKSSEQVPAPAKTTGHIVSGQTPHIRALSKSRDPRLRLAYREVSPSNLNARPLLRDTPKTDPVEGIINLRKNKNVGETLVDGQALKKQKNGSTNSEVSRDVQMARGGGWLENCSTSGTPVIDRIQSAESMGTDFRKPENGGIFSGQRQVTSSGTFNAKTGETEHLPLPVIGTSTTASLPSLLKDIVVNPTMLMQLIMEQQRLAVEAQRSSNLLQGTSPAFTSSITSGAAPLVSVAPSKSYDAERKFVENPRILSQMTSTNSQGESGNIRMKPRDPRRILRSSTFQNNESLGSEQFNMNGAPMSSSQANTHNLSGIQQNEPAQASFLPSQSSPPPDIARQFTKNLRNLADILSSQSTDSISTVTQGCSSSQSILVNVEKTDVGVSTTDSNDQQSGTVLTPEGVTETSRSQNTWGDVEHLFEGYDDKQKAAIQRERARRIEEQNKMFAAKKLCLVLDLDHTLLNSAKFVEVEPMHEEILRKKEEQDREKPQRHLFRFSHMGMWTKLRPGIWTFLEKASKLYELHLYTMGNKLYATEMAKVLDPTGVLFAGRVISKGDDGDPFDSDDKLPKSKDLEGVLGMESAVVIIDDSVKVWPHNKLNLILVERYTYFPCSRRQFGLPGPSLLEIDHDERPEDGTLASSSAVIERLHQNFFSNPSLHEVDVRNILSSEQRKILAGCRILFSRIFPVGEAKPHQHPLWQTAEQFGAVCTTQIDNLVTHVVANSLGTDKVNWAMSTGRFVVHPGWVEASALLYRRANEQDFAVKINLP